MNRNKRGEIAMVVAFATLIVIGMSSLIISNVLKQKFTFLPRAQQSTTWSWDEAAGRCPDKGSGLAPCICRELGSDGICTPVGDINGSGSVCIANRWDNSWGCWGNPSSANVPAAADSTSATGSSCSLTKSQYGTCPDSVTENGCYQRLDPPGDPDYGKWFKCVNRWWNGPCDSKEACDGGVAAPPPADTAPVVPINRSGLSGCYNFSNTQNCANLCKQGRPGVDPAQEWYCSDNWEGKSNNPGLYCCPTTATVPPPADAPPDIVPPVGIPGRLDGPCLTIPGPNMKYCLTADLTCNQAINTCEKSLALPVGAATTPAPGELGSACGIPLVACKPGLECVNRTCVTLPAPGELGSACGIPLVACKRGLECVDRICSPAAGTTTVNSCFEPNEKTLVGTYDIKAYAQFLCGTMLKDTGDYIIYTKDCTSNGGNCQYECLSKSSGTRDDCWTGQVQFGDHYTKIMFRNSTDSDVTINTLNIFRKTWNGVRGYYGQTNQQVVVSKDSTQVIDLSDTPVSCGKFGGWGERVVINNLIYKKTEEDDEDILLPGLPKEYDCEDDLAIYLEIN